MSLATENTKKTSADFSFYFDFLTKDYGLNMTMESYSTTGGNRYVRILRNQFVQAELAGDQSYFHAEIRRLIDGEPRPFSDAENNIGFEDLAVLITNNNYDHFDFYPASVGWTKVLENTVELFKKSKELFTTDKWIDTKRIEGLKDEEFFKQFGFKPSENKSKPAFFGLVKQHAFKLLDKGYKLTLDSSELPPYNEDSISSKIILEGFNKQVKISQRDWRDNYTCYYVAIDGKEIFQLDTTNYEDVQAAVIVFNEHLDKLIL